MTDGSIFQGDKPNTDVQPATDVQAPTNAEFVATLVGEGKKYKSVDDLAKAYVSADDFIEKLKAENYELRNKAQAGKTIDDVLERMQQQQSQPQDKGVQELSPSDLTKLVEQTVTGLETKKQKEANLLKADAKMKEMFGDKASEKFAEVAKTPELKQVYMQLASVDPDKFVGLFVGSGQSSVGVDVGGINTTMSYSSTSGMRQSQEGTKEYYDNIRRTNPSLYYSQDFQLQMDKRVRSNPDSYYGKRA